MFEEMYASSPILSCGSLFQNEPTQYELNLNEPSESDYNRCNSNYRTPKFIYYAFYTIIKILPTLNSKAGNEEIGDISLNKNNFKILYGFSENNLFNKFNSLKLNEEYTILPTNLKREELKIVDDYFEDSEHVSLCFCEDKLNENNAFIHQKGNIYIQKTLKSTGKYKNYSKAKKLYFIQQVKNNPSGI